MEPLWSPVGCNQWQSLANRIGAEPAKQAKTVAVGCNQLPQRAHGKEVARLGDAALARLVDATEGRRRPGPWLRLSR
jgi:hypothetical protein